jgi:hypothetical protein
MMAAPGAKLQDLDALRTLRAAAIAFSERGAAALGEADGQAAKMMNYLRLEAEPMWRTELRKLHDKHQALKSELTRKQATAIADNPTFLELRKAVEAVKAKMEHAEITVRKVRAAQVELERQWTLYKAATSAMRDSVDRMGHHAVHRLDAMVDALQGYQAVDFVDQAGAEARKVAGEQAGEAGGEQP